MTQFSNIFILADQSWPVDCLTQLWPKKAAVNVWVEGKGWVSRSPQNKKLKKSSGGALGAVELVNAEPSATDVTVAIVGFQDAELSHAVVSKLREKSQKLKILEIGARGSRAQAKTTVRSVMWKDLLPDNFGYELELLDIQERVSKIKDQVADSNAVALLLQDDPDPDGLASALALRKVLGRNALTAPIVSFGAISRPENLAMARLLEISVEKVSEKDLQRFEKIIMIDCQPSFFKGRAIRPEVIIDHHPKALAEGGMPENILEQVPVVEIREDLGAISTLMTQFLRSQKIEISSRVATALLYGIKSDTLALNRQVSESDLEAFLHLYPRANGNMLRKIERPELPLGYLEVLRKALKGFRVKKGIAVLSLGPVGKEEWIPQAADFAMQAEGAEWSIGCGVFDSKVILSLRNCGYTFHGGDLFKELFNGIGCAGGHRSMAKAIISLPDWIEKFGSGSISSGSIQKIVQRLLTKAINEKGESQLTTANA